MTESQHSVSAVSAEPTRLDTRIRDADGLFAGFDFDGTLAPITSDPDAAAMDVRVESQLRRLAKHDEVRVAVVSGRELDDLKSRVNVDGVVFAGNHGLERFRDGKYTVQPDAAKHLPTVHSLSKRLQASLAEVPGCRVEDKGLTLSVHVRQTPLDRIEEVRQTVQNTVGEQTGLAVSRGKEVFEVRPQGSHDKGITMADLAREAPENWLTLYLGDDTTDEDAFEAIQPEGIGIHVGTEADTSARYRISAQEDVPSFVDWLTSAVSGSS